MSSPVAASQPTRSRIVLVAAALDAGGAERQLVDMANYWVERNCPVTLVTWAGQQRGDFYRIDSRVRRVEFELASAGGLLSTLSVVLRRVVALRRLLRDEKPDVVLSFLTEINILTILASAGLPVRVAISERAHPAHDTTVRPVWRALRRYLYSRADVVVAQTRETAAWIRGACGTDAIVIPNALRLLAEREEPRQPLVVAVGRLTRQKGFDLLLRAMARIAGDFPEWQVMIFGEGPELQNLSRLRDELSLSQRVTFAGVTRDVETWLARAGVVVQPSRFEGFPNAVLEAMGLGAAVISTDCPAGPSDLIEDGVNGRLVPVEDDAALSRAMADLMSQPRVRERFGREARSAKERFRQQRIMAQWEAALLSGEEGT